jgi:hypothetical protein
VANELILLNGLVGVGAGGTRNAEASDVEAGGANAT